MIRVTTETDQKLVDVTITGFVKTEEALRVSTELKQSMRHFGPQEAVLLIDLIGFAPMSNDVLSLLRGMGRDVITFFRKAALVQEFSQKIQGRRIIEPPPGITLRSFSTREEALQYLSEIE